MSDPTEITCRLADCIFFQGPASTPNRILCSHAEAHRYIYTDPPCPLYRLDWQKKMAASPAVFTPYRKKR